MAELAGWQTLQLVSDWRKCHNLSCLSIARLGPEIIANDSLYTSHSCDRMISSVIWQVLGMMLPPVECQRPMLLVFFQILEQNSELVIQRMSRSKPSFAWSFSLSSGHPRTFFPEQLCIQQACVCWIFGSLLFPTKLMRRWFTHGRDDIQIAQYTEKALRDLSPPKFESQNSKLSRHGLTSWLYSLGGPIL